MRHPPRWPAPRRENEALPPQGESDFWERLSLPVLSFLEEPRNWQGLIEWSTEHRFSRTRLRQVLAWLEQQGKASTYTLIEGRKATVYWASADWLKKNTGPQLPQT